MFRNLFLLLCLFCTVSVTAQKKSDVTSKATQNENEIDYKQQKAPLPPFIFVPYYDTGSKVTDQKDLMTNEDFDNGANLFVMMFNPTCGHCQGQTMMFEKSADLFKKSKLLLVATPMMKTYLPDFVALTHANQYSFIEIGLDSAGFVNNLFLYQSLPQVNIYDGERKLIRTYTGEVSMDSLRKYIQ